MKQQFIEDYTKRAKVHLLTQKDQAKRRLSKFRKASSSTLSTSAYLELKKQAKKDEIFLSACKRLKS